MPAAELQELIDRAGLGVQLSHLAWSARVRVQHRVAERFRQGRLFLAGDAAHAYSPATGQGMNTAIQDAANLGWKLAFASAQPASAALLGSYEEERRPVARRVLAVTHLAFWGEASAGRLPALLRSLAPLATTAVPALMGRRRLIAAGYRRLSQLDANYRGSALSADSAPRQLRGPRAGDRLPDMIVTCGGRRVRLHELLARPGIHVLLERQADPPGPLGPMVVVHRLTSVPGCGMMAIRPDGHIGLRFPRVETGPLLAWLARARPS